VRLLLEHGAEVNKVAKSGRTALMIADLAPSSAERVRLLLTRGARVSTEDQAGLTPLMAATLGNDTDSVRLLIDAGAEVNHSGSLGPNGPKGLTPLMLAAENGNIEAVRLLLAKIAKINATSERQDLAKERTGQSLPEALRPCFGRRPTDPPSSSRCSWMRERRSMLPMSAA
jgi:ankyrin repeat protein